MCFSLTSCKVVNTHVVKLTSTPEIDPSFGILVKTTKGNVYLSAQHITPNAREMLLGVRPFQCLAIRTSESFDMNNRNVYFTEFKVKKLMESDSECRKIKVSTRIYAN